MQHNGTFAVGGAGASKDDGEDGDDDPCHRPSCLWPGDDGFVEMLPNREPGPQPAKEAEHAYWNGTEAVGVYHGKQWQYQCCIDWHILTNHRDYLQELQGHMNRVVQGEQDVNWLFYDAKSRDDVSKAINASITYQKPLWWEAISIDIRCLNHMRDIFANPNLY